MKAAIYNSAGPADVLRYSDVADPEVGPGHVLIEVRAISVEGGDLINRRMTPPPAADHIPGYAASGTVIAVGSEVDDRKVGQRVTSFDMAGSHAALRSVPAGQTWLVPEGVAWAQAAALPISFAAAHHSLFARGALQKGETVLLQGGAGGVGLAAIQLAKAAGATVLATSSRPERLARLRSIGADHVIDHKEEDVAAAVLDRTGGRGADLIVDPVGSTLQTSLAALGASGRLVFVGNAGGSELTVDLWPALMANQSLLGVFMGTELAKPDVYATVDQMLADVAKARLTVFIDREFPLADAAGAHRYAEERSPFGRVVIRVE